MSDPYPPPLRTPSALPLVLAGAAFALTAYLVYDRVRGPGPIAIEPRAVDPRGDLMDLEKTMIGIFEANRPSVAHITTKVVVRRYGVLEEYPAGSGSGFVWDTQGVIVTNYHVVAGHERGTVHVSLGDGREAEAKLIAASRENDIAVLRLLDDKSGLRPIPLGTSNDLKVGQAAFAIGNPFGFDHSFTFGVVGALNRSIQTQSGSKLEGLIQVDTAINPGNSGGPLLDSAGRLIGMSTAIYSPSGASAGLGFAVPVDTIREVVNDLLAGGTRATVRGRALIGVDGLTTVTLNGAGAPQRYGAVFDRVMTGTGASEAGLKPTKSSPGSDIEELGDVILAVDGAPIRSKEEVVSMLSRKQIGQRVSLRVLRGFPEKPEVLDIPVTLK